LDLDNNEILDQDTNGDNGDCKIKFEIENYSDHHKEDISENELQINIKK